VADLVTHAMINFRPSNNFGLHFGKMSSTNVDEAFISSATNVGDICRQVSTGDNASVTVTV